MEKEEKSIQRIRFYAADEEEGREPLESARERHRRRSSVGSLSIHSTGGARSVDPGTTLPITYRTLSIEVNEENQKKQSEVKRAKEKGAVDLAVLEWYVAQTNNLPPLEAS